MQLILNLLLTEQEVIVSVTVDEYRDNKSNQKS